VAASSKEPVVSFTMSAAEREQFLAGLHVGIFSVAEDTRGPIAVPVWYDYQPGGQVSVITGRSSRKARAIRAAGRVSLCAQDEAPPYRYVSVEGPVVLEEVEFDERLAMARRYLGREGGDRYMATEPDSASEDLVVRMTPEHWLGVDYGKEG
jgi:PPOX class probable F420-dependent enzyme